MEIFIKKIFKISAEIWLFAEFQVVQCPPSYIAGRIRHKNDGCRHSFRRDQRRRNRTALHAQSLRPDPRTNLTVGYLDFSSRRLQSR